MNTQLNLANRLIPKPVLSERKCAKPAAPQPSETDLSGGIYALALSQFAVLALGMMAVTILTKVGGGETGPTAMAVVLMRIGLWTFLLPLGWTIIALVVASFCSKRSTGEVILSTGCGIVLLIVGAVALALL
jgi:hypothetical protein